MKIPDPKFSVNERVNTTRNDQSYVIINRLYDEAVGWSYQIKNLIVRNDILMVAEDKLIKGSTLKPNVIKEIKSELLKINKLIERLNNEEIK